MQFKELKFSFDLSAYQQSYDAFSVKYSYSAVQFYLTLNLRIRTHNELWEHKLVGLISQYFHLGFKLNLFSQVKDLKQVCIIFASNYLLQQ